MCGSRRRVVTGALAAGGAFAGAALLLWVAMSSGGGEDAGSAALPEPVPPESARDEPGRPILAPGDSWGPKTPPDLPAPREPTQNPESAETGEPFWSWEKTDPRPELPPGEPGSISGRVVDDAGEPIEGARVWLSSLNFGAEALADANGEFRVSGLPPGEYRVEARFDGSLVQGEGPFRVEPRLETPVGDLVLVPGGTVEGEVVFPDAPSGEFTIVWRRHGGDRFSRLRTFRTASPPSFSILVPPGGYRFHALAPGYAASAAVAVAVAARGRERVVLVLERGATLSGSVLTRDGAPAAGARVSVRPEIPTLDDFRSLMGLQTVADAEGRFSVTGLEPGVCIVEASVPGRSPAVAKVELAGAENSIDLVLPAGCRLEGIVIDTSGVPQPGAGVVLQLEAESGGASYQHEIPTDDQGRFVLQDLPPGKYRVRAHVFSDRSRPPRSGTARIEVPDGGAGQVRVVVE
ncbi:MAG: carboxypeptidase regulatory-like domain-containing protein [Planctomycetes bacterium]|nr:carboxypeptidase regulatory-like domain-containing protein [Planctomycetota bacterium]